MDQCGEKSDFFRNKENKKHSQFFIDTSNFSNSNQIVSFLFV